MSEFTSIIAFWLWRFFPAVWLDWVIVRNLARGFAWLEDEDHQAWLDESQANCAWFAGFIATLEERLNELIVLKAMIRLKRPFLGTPPKRHVPVRSVRTPRQAFLRLVRLGLRYRALDRLVERRVRSLHRLLEPAIVELATVHHPVDAQPATIPGWIPTWTILIWSIPGWTIFSGARASGDRIRAPPGPAPA